MPTIDNEYSTPKITPADGVKIPSVSGDSGYQLDEELREYIQNGVTGVDEQYSTLMTYAYGKRLKHEGVEYRCIVPVESPEIFDPDKWVKVDLTELDKRVLDNASAINAITRHTRKTDFSLTDLQNAVADQDLAKYGLHVGDQKTINGHTYVIAGLNVMKGAHSYNHVGLIVIPHTTTKWNGSSTSGGYAGSNLHSYLVNTVLPMCNTDLGSSHLYHHQKMLSNAVDDSRINRYGQATGASSGWGWVDSYISALTEMQVYGGTVWSSSGYDTGEADQQLPVFQEFKHTDIFGSEYPWLRDVASSSRACLADDGGSAGVDGVSSPLYVAGLILYH